MVRVKPFAAIRPPKNLVTEVAAPPYDVLNSEEALAMARRGRELVKEMFDAEANTGKLYELYAAHADLPSTAGPGSGRAEG